MSSRATNAAIIAALTKRLAAMQKYLGDKKTEVPVAGQMLKTTAITAAFQKCLDTRAAVSTKKAELKAALTERDAAEAERLTIEDALPGYVMNRFGADSAEAHEFEYSPRKPAVVPVETKLQAIARGKATREARHTMGKKQKSKIKGTTVVLTASADPANAAPAPSASEGAATAQESATPALSPAQAQAAASAATPVNGSGH